MHKMFEHIKLDTALKPLASGADLTGQYFNMHKWRKALFHAFANGQTNGQSFTFSVYEAKDATGGTPLQLGGDVTFTQGSKIAACTVTMNSPDVDTDTVKITPYTIVGGVLTAGTELTFTPKAAEDKTAREYDQSGNTTAQALSLANCINDPTYGVPGMLAVPAVAVVTLTMTEPGSGVFDITEVDVAKTVVVDLIQEAWFEVDVEDMSDTYTHIGARSGSVDANTFVGCTLMRSLPRYAPTGQAVTGDDDSS